MKESDEKVRAFICLELPEHVKKTIGREAIAPLERLDARCSWVKPDNLHLTLKFLGDIPETLVPKLAAVLEKVVAKYHPISLSLKNVGTFGGRTPRVVWVGLEGELKSLAEMAKAVDRATSELGFAREKRRFAAHLTIARVRGPRGTERLVEEAGRIKLPADCFSLDRMILMKSTLSPRGSIYEPLAEFDLNKKRT
ncbi:RNA 2',3'-cyclic phosphodiesterase [bacterium]|nr:RNA 2',3'-cyclic phosphodiesterase [bacterium]